MSPGTPEQVAGLLASRCGEDVVELRLDALPPAACSADALRAWIGGASAPVLATCRPGWQGGGFRGPERERRSLLEAALDAGARWIDVELVSTWVEELLPAAAERLLLSHHWDRPRPQDLDSHLQRLLRLHPAIGKLVAPADRAGDAAGLLAAGRRLAAAGIVPACFAMGTRGSASRLIAGLDGGLVYARGSDNHGADDLDAEGAGTAPGQWSLTDLTGDLAAGRWRPGAARYGLLGDPLEHSLSPAVFNAAFAAVERPACYVPLPGRPFADALRLADEAGFRGLSVTMPFKTKAAHACRGCSSLAQRSGVVNTLVRVEDGWEGHNTDGGAAVAALSTRIDVAGASVVLVGAGGAARAAAFALRDAGAEVRVLNRTVARARQLALEVGAAGWGAPEDLERISCDALVNATPVGMDGTAHTPVSTAWLRGGEVVMEMVYRPQLTALLREARARGCRVVPGVEMFLRQAAAQHELWLGEPPPAGVMRIAAESRL